MAARIRIEYSVSKNEDFDYIREEYLTKIYKSVDFNVTGKTEEEAEQLLENIIDFIESETGLIFSRCPWGGEVNGKYTVGDGITVYDMDEKEAIYAAYKKFKANKVSTYRNINSD